MSTPITVKNPDLILKLSEGMEDAGFYEMELWPEEFCDLLNYHGARLTKLNLVLPKRYYPKTKNPESNPKIKLYSELKWKDHIFITEHESKIHRVGD